MKTYAFSIARSRNSKHQVRGIKCSDYTVKATIKAASMTKAKAAAIRWMAIPGVYALHIQEVTTDGSGQGLCCPEVDTRNPEAAEAVLKLIRFG